MTPNYRPSTSHKYFVVEIEAPQSGEREGQRASIEPGLPSLSQDLSRAQIVVTVHTTSHQIGLKNKATKYSQNKEKSK